jgi:hypothetical protein
LWEISECDLPDAHGQQELSLAHGLVGRLSRQSNDRQAGFFDTAM